MAGWTGSPSPTLPIHLLGFARFVAARIAIFPSKNLCDLGRISVATCSQTHCSIFKPPTGFDSESLIDNHCATSSSTTILLLAFLLASVSSFFFSSSPTRKFAFVKISSARLICSASSLTPTSSAHRVSLSCSLSFSSVLVLSAVSAHVLTSNREPFKATSACLTSSTAPSPEPYLTSAQFNNNFLLFPSSSCTVRSRHVMVSSASIFPFANSSNLSSVASFPSFHLSNLRFPYVNSICLLTRYLLTTPRISIFRVSDIQQQS